MWCEEGPRHAEVLLEGGRIAAIGASLAAGRGARILDAQGLEVMPAYLDLHVHAADRIGPYELADSWETVARAALATGVTTLFGFVTQAPGESLAAAVARCRARAVGAPCDVRFHLTPTGWPWPWGEVEELMAHGFTTFKLYTTYREAGLYTSYDRLAEVMEWLAPRGGRLLVHCEDEGVLAAAGQRPADPADPVAHALWRPPEAEVEAIRRVVALAAATACPTHIVHVSTGDGAQLVAAARRAGAPVTCETAPHYLCFSDAALRRPDGHRFLCTPPLRPEEVRQGLVAAAVAGQVHVFATDHCAFRRVDKDGQERDARKVPRGVAGAGALVPVTYELLVARRGLPLGSWLEALATTPARVAGLYPRRGVIREGAEADLVVLAPSAAPVPVRATRADAYDPYGGMEVGLAVRWVVREGRVVLGPEAGARKPA